MNVDDDLVQRIGDALDRSWRGRVIATPDDEQLAEEIAWEIPAQICRNQRVNCIRSK
jgi:hypothetical protein